MQCFGLLTENALEQQILGKKFFSLKGFCLSTYSQIHQSKKFKHHLRAQNSVLPALAFPQAHYSPSLKHMSHLTVLTESSSSCTV